jgi:hypothetical protein
MTKTAKIQNVVIQDGNKRSVLTPFEKRMDFVSFVRFAVNGRSIGAYLARQGESDYRITFAFECEGISPSITDDLIDSTVGRIEEGFKDLPPGESVTFHLTSFADDLEKQVEIRSQIDKIKAGKFTGDVDAKVIQGLLHSQKERIHQLKEQGLRKPKKLTVYCTYTSVANGEGRDLVEKGLNVVIKFFRKNVTGEYDKLEYEKFQDFIEFAYRDGLKQWEMFFTKLGLKASPLTVEEIWANTWKRFNKTQPIAVPHILEFNGETISEIDTVNVSTISTLWKSKTSIPEVSRTEVHCNESCQAVMYLANKPSGWADNRDQLRYIWTLFASEKTIDTEVYVQVVMGNPQLMQNKLSTLTKQAIGRANLAAKEGGVGVQATMAIEESVEAQRLLFEGAIPLKTCVAFIVHRPTLEELEMGCRTLANNIYQPAYLQRELDYCNKPWLQTFIGMKWDLLYTNPDECGRFPCINQDIPGFLPIVKNTSPDKEGFELIALEGSEPIHFDLYSKVRHLAFFAGTRGSKSVTASDPIVGALAREIPVSILDYPRDDGTGTFSEFVPLLNGAYFNTSTEKMNLFELPNLRKFKRDEQERRLNDYKDSLLDILQTIVLGLKPERSEQGIRAILTIAIAAFFEDVSIQRRYNAANTNGFGSTAWKEQPTLIDFMSFCTVGRLPMQSPTPETYADLDYISLRFTGFVDSKIGRSLSSASTFKTDAQLFAIALAQLNNPTEALIIALAASLVIKRRSLAYKRSIVVFDEAAILCRFDAMSTVIGDTMANGAKSGIGAIILAQEPMSIKKSVAGDKIFVNLSTIFIGKINPGAIDDFIDILKLPREMVVNCADKAFEVNIVANYSNWVIQNQNSYTLCRHYPSELLLAAVANNPNETEIRLKHLRQEPNKVKALMNTAQELLHKGK